jgi:hypothetical protein
VFLSLIIFKHTDMKLTFDINLLPGNLAKAVADGKTTVQVVATLIADDGDKKQSDGKQQLKVSEAEMTEEDPPASVTGTYSDEQIVKLGVSKVQTLPYKVLQSNLKARGVSAGGKRSVLASRLHSAARDALEKAQRVDAIVIDLVGDEELPPKATIKEEGAERGGNKEAAEKAVTAKLDEDSDVSFEDQEPEKARMRFHDDEDSVLTYQDDPVLSQEVAMLYALRDSMENSTIGN